jgi:alpha-tubulin suppressor-like RCC1 family protein
MSRRLAILAILAAAACTEHATPLDVSNNPGTVVFRYIDAGSYHTCGLTTGEMLLCWGYGADGQLGVSGTAPQAFPTPVPGDLRYRLVSGGRYHSCGLTLAGNAYCWGNNGEGRLGNGGTDPGSPTPTPVVIDSSVSITYQSIQAGRVHSCAIDLSQTAWCWGYNGEGELGQGTAAPGSHSAVALVAQTGAAIKSISPGGLHTCAISVAGGGLCWGYNASGQLGNGTTITSGTPSAVSGGLTFRTDPAVVFPSPDPDFPLPPGPFLASGYQHTCAIATDANTYCWGLNEDGQLGDGTRTSRTIPGPIVAPALVAVTAGLRHTCGLTAASLAYCWGDNTFGQLGDGTTTTRTTATAVIGGLNFAYLKAGDLSTCGVTTTGVAYCWGDNEFSQLGDGTSVGSAAPVKVAFQP